MIGQTLDHYQIESKLGQGGMGVVYKGWDNFLERPVAIKVLLADKIPDPSSKQRFIQEARAASALNHPGIVTIHDIRSDAGTDFIVMEYVEGKTLDELIGAKGLRPAQALRYALQVADALAKAHEAGILHCDLKPSNIIVTDDEQRTKILDFGLAQLLEPAGSSPDSTTLSAEAVVAGTAEYMSPEQVEGRKLDARSDIFSFGSVLYQMVTGRKPFTGDSKISILSKIVSEEPTAPGQLSEHSSPELERIILRCLRKDPARRYQTTAELRIALEDVQEGRRSSQPELVPQRRWLLAALPVLLIAGYFVWQEWRERQTTEPPRAAVLTTLPGPELYPSFSPDGNHVAFMWSGPKQDNRDVYVQQIGSGAPLRLTTDPCSDYNPVWSPDGRWIAFLRGESPGHLAHGRRELRLIPPLGGPERKIAEIRVGDFYPEPACLAWCPDSTCLIVADSSRGGETDALFVVSIETGEKRRLTDPQPDLMGDSSPALSPDGRSLVFRRLSGWAASELYQLSLGPGLTVDGKPTRLGLAPPHAAYPTWLPDSKEILCSANGSLWRLPPNSPAVRLAFVGEDGIMPAVSRPQPGHPSRLVYVRSIFETDIWRVETPGSGAPANSPPVVAIASTRVDANPQLSPDGCHVAFESVRSGTWEIWISDLDGSNSVQLTSLGAGVTGTPRWSPDGQFIAFDTNLNGHFNIHVIPAAGGKSRRITSGTANEHHPSFSRDRRSIYFASNRSGEYQIWKAAVSGGEPVQVTYDGGQVAFESMDGKWLYYTQTVGPAPAVLWRIPTTGGQPIKVLDGVIERAFTAVEEGIYYIDRPMSEARLGYLEFATGNVRIVSPALGHVMAGLTASSDGRTILYTKLNTLGDDLMLVENFR
jgi:serine/threonine protein kinase